MEKTTMPLNFEAERARLMQARAVKIETENAVARGELITIEAAHHMVMKGIERMRVKMLARFPDIAPLMLNSKTVPLAHALVEGAIFEALDECAAEIEAVASDVDPEAA